MTINDHLSSFAGLPVEDFDADSDIKPLETVYRLSVPYEESEAGTTWIEKFTEYMEKPGSKKTIGLVVGDWGSAHTGEDPESAVDALAEANDRLPSLRYLFFGDLIMEESEISWIKQCDLSPLLNAYPLLTHFGVRGGDGLSFGRLKHANLQWLVVETGGLPATVLAEISAADLPELEHLELWLGDDGYGADATAEDLKPILSGKLFPKLKYLGLRDSYIANEVAEAVACAPILQRIDILDLSLGTLNDEGAEHLIKSPLIKKLKVLDVHHNYLGSETCDALQALGIAVNIADMQDDEGDEDNRFVAVGE